jgi:hypothetical protein
MSAAQGRSNRRKGADTERMVVAWLRENGWPDAKRRLAGNGQAGDIDGVPGVLIECKYVARSSWPSWQFQALAESTLSTELVVVVRRTHGNPNVAEWDARWCDVSGPWVEIGDGCEPMAPWEIGTFDRAMRWAP